MQAEKFKTVEEYIATFPESTQALLQQMRDIFKKAAPQGTEVISYNMPAIKINKVVAYFAGYKNHIGFYPMGTAIVQFATELKDYKTSKGAVQFPLDKVLNKDLITRMVQFNVMLDKAFEKNKK